MSEGQLTTGTVVRFTNERAVFAVRDLSAIGARLLGPLRLHAGERLRLELELDGGRLAIAAEVLRFDPQRAEASVGFRELAPEARAAIERSIAAMLETRGGARVVAIVHPDPETCAAMQRDLARIGLASRTGATLGELADPLADVAGVIVGVDHDAILHVLEERHPALVRVALFGDRVEAIDHATRVHAVLRTPWRIKGLARAFGVDPRDVTTTYDQLAALPADD